MAWYPSRRSQQRFSAEAKRAEELGGRVVQEPQHVPGVAFAFIADPQGHIVGLTHQG